MNFVCKPNHFQGDMSDVRPRKLWQELFDLYRQNGGPIHSMDNMLIDLDLCKQAFDQLNTSNQIVFFWGFDAGVRFGCTRWRWESEIDPGWERIALGTDKCYKFTLEWNGYSMREIVEEPLETGEQLPHATPSAQNPHAT